MTENFSASVVIPCYRADEVLPLQLEALARQVDAPWFEVLLVDNGSNPALHRVADTFRGRVPHIRVIEAHDRQGAGYARNVGIGAAAADRLLFCDADDVVMPEWVALGVAQLDRHPVFSGGAVPVSEALCREGWQAVVDHVGPHEDVETPLPPSGSREYPILMGGSFGIRRDLALRLGGFDLSFGSAAEDNDMAFRIVEAGLVLPDAGQVCIAYRVRDESGGFGRGLRAGIAHGLLCARHNAWRVSPAFRGRWLARLAKSLVSFPVPALRRQKVSPQQRDALGRQLGCFFGWVRYRAGMGLPPTELGVGLMEGRTHV